MIIRRASLNDQNKIWLILEPVIRAGETYALPRTMTKQEAIEYWLSTEKMTYVAEDEGEILGTYYLRANQLGAGSHVCNCGYVTSEAARGRGIAAQMCEHSLAEARKAGYRGMQYNLVASTNAGAVRLWRRLGFETVGTLPNAFHHPTHGDVDAYVMFKSLSSHD